MSPRKKAVAPRDRDAAVIPTPSAPRLLPARVPASASGSSSSSSSSLGKFVLLVLASLTLSTLLHPVIGEATLFELASASRRLEEWWQVGLLFGWRVIVLGAGWFGGCDDLDLASLTLLTQFPFYFLLRTFYATSPIATYGTLAVDVLANTAPFSLLRARSPFHAADPAPQTVRNRSLIQDTQVKLTTALLAASVYALTLYAACRTFLPSFTVSHFDIRTLEGAYEASLQGLLLTFIPAGLAARTYLFTPSAGAPVREWEAFDPVSASFGQTVRHNIWGWSAREKVLIRRGVLLAVLTGVNTGLRCWTVIEGVEGVGAAGWAGLWVVANALVGGAFWWVGNV